MCRQPWNQQTHPSGKLLTPGAVGQASRGLEQTRNCIAVPACDNKFIKLLAVNPAQAYNVMGSTNGKQFKCMIDTGASVSLIREDAWSSLATECHKLLPWQGCRLIGAEGSEICVKGVVTLELQIDDITVRGDFLVTSRLSSEIILGLDFLEQNHCVINTDQKTLHLQGKAIPLKSGLESETLMDFNNVSVVLAAKIEIPPLSEVETMASAVLTGEYDKFTGLVEHCIPASKSPVIVASALVMVQPRSSQGCKVPLRLMNPTAEVTTLHKGTKIALLNCITDTEVVANVGEGMECPAEVPAGAEDMLWNLVESSGEALDPQQQMKLHTLLLQFVDVFAFSDSDLRQTQVSHHTIPTESAPPIRQPTRRIPPHRREEVSKLLKNMLARNIIQPSTSPWASPIVIVRKKDGSARFCVDYRKLNAVTRKDAYPLPRIDDTLDTLSGSQWFSTLDLLSGYWQVKVAEEDQQKTAFTTHDGLFEFKVMPFGLCNAPATFQRVMDLVLAGVQWSQCLVYLDDIIVIGRNFDEHIQNLSTVLQRLREANLRIKPSKCNFCREQVTYLGHIVSKFGVATDPEKTAKVADWPTPTTVQQLQQFLGLASYYRRFVKDFSLISAPLHRLTERGREFQWTNECAQAFSTLKHHLTHTPVLTFPDFTKPFTLDTDASHSGIGAVLSQTFDGQERVIAYASRALTKAERRYCVTRKELLAAVTFIQQFRSYLLGNKFKLRTDHSSLKWLQTFKEPEGQMARWLETLQEYQFDIVHRAGVKHLNADALSRIPPCTQCSRAECLVDHENQSGICSNNNQDNAESIPVATTRLIPHDSNTLTSSSTNPPEQSTMRHAQLHDETIGPLLQFKEANQQPMDTDLAGVSHALCQLYQ